MPELMKYIFGGAMFSLEESSTRPMVGLLEQMDQLIGYQVQLPPDAPALSLSFHRRASNLNECIFHAPFRVVATLINEPIMCLLSR